jgi:NADH dehydrogenase
MAAEVLILGGGFAGLSAAITLSKCRRDESEVRIRLVDRLGHNVFLPLLPDVISGMVRPEHICHDLAGHCGRLGVDFVEAEVRKISLSDRRVQTSRGEFRCDYLVLALGSVTNYYGNDTVREHTFGFKTVREALAIAHEATALVEKAEAAHPMHPEERARVLIVGGGYTGFEIAGAIAKLIHIRTRHPYPRLRELLRISILEKNDTSLPHSSSRVQEWVLDLVKNYDIDVRTRTTVKTFPAPRTVELSDGSVLEDAMVVWTAGVRPAPVLDELTSARLHDRRLTVDPYLRLPDDPTVFAAGDVAGVIPPGRNSPLYMGVQFSLRGGYYAALNILRSIRKKPLIVFDPVDAGYLVPLAPGQAAGEVLGREVHGRIPCWMHYALCVFRSWNWHNRWSVFRDFVFKNPV